MKDSPTYDKIAEVPELLAIMADSRISSEDAARRITANGIKISGPTVRHLRIEREKELSESFASSQGRGRFSAEDRASLHDRLDKIIEVSNLSPGDVTGLRVSKWDGLTKNEDGTPEVTTLYGVKLDVKRPQLAPTWPVVQPANPVTVKSVRPAPGVIRRSKLAVILPDPQIGYRSFAGGELDPFHDESAIDVALQILSATDPDVIVNLGDFLDLPAFGTYEQEQAFSATTQESVNRGHAFLAQQAAAAPRAKKVVMEGNHDRRLQRMIVRNAMAAFGLRTAVDTSGWPVLSVPYLCGFESMDTEYVEGYPAGEYWLNDRLKCIHGLKVRSSGSTAKAVVDDERVSTIFGHIHRIETHYRTTSNRSGGRARLAHTPGCLCRIDGAVPSVKGSTDLSGRPVRHFEDWQHGVTVVEYTKGDGPFSLTPVFINTHEGYEACLGGRVYRPRLKKAA